MERTLLLMRHAKSSWKTQAPSDHARPLNARGRRAAPAVARELASRGKSPNVVLSSDSVRTVQTWECMRDFFDARIDVRFHSSLYHTGHRELELLLQGLDDAIGCVLALGHNPGWDETVAHLAGVDIDLKTADVAVLGGHGESWKSSWGAKRWELLEHISARAVSERGDQWM